VDKSVSWILYTSKDDNTKYVKDFFTRALSRIFGSKAEVTIVEIKGLESNVNKIAQVLGATRDEVNVVFRFADKIEVDKKLNSLLKAIGNSETVDHKPAPKIAKLVFSYSSLKLPVAIEIAQEICMELKVPYNVLWEPLVETDITEKIENETNGNGPFNSIALSLNIDDIPEARFLTESKPILIPSELGDTVFRQHLVEERFWYWDEKASAAYYYLKESPNYEVFTNNYRVLRRNSAELISTVFEKLSINPNETRLLDLVALGVGSTEKEMTLLEEIHTYYRLNKFDISPSKSFHYFPVDISFPLLQNSIRALLSRSGLRKIWLEDRLRVRPILTDILRLFDTQIMGNQNKLVAALGLLWNLPIQKAFNSFKRILTEKDLLLVDVEFIGNRTEEEIRSSYDGKESKDFFYHSLDLLREAATTTGQFETRTRYGVRLKPYSVFKFYDRKYGEMVTETVVGNSVNKLIEKYKLPNSIKEHLNFGPLKKSQTVVILFKPSDKKVGFPIVLGYSTRFDYAELETYIEKMGFQTIKKYLDNPSDEEATVGYFLLEPHK